MPGVGDSSRQARRGLRCAFGPVPAATAVCSLVPSAANPSPTLEWGTGPRPEKRQNSLSSSPLSPIRRTLLPAHALTPVTLETPNTQLVTSISGTPASLPSFREERSALIYGILCPQCFRGTPKPMLILKLQFAFQQLCCLPVHWRVVCNVVNIFLSALWRRAKCPQCPIPGLPLSHNATGHLYAHFYIYLLVCRVHDVFPVFVGVENIEPAMDWNKIQVSVQLKLKSLTKGIEANLK